MLSIPSATPPPFSLLLLHPSPSLSPIILTGLVALRRVSRLCAPPLVSLQHHYPSLHPSIFKVPIRAKCLANPAAEGQFSDSKSTADETTDDEDRADDGAKTATSSGGSRRSTASSSSDLLSLGIPEPVYEVVEITSNGMISTKKINRRHLLKLSGLRPRDIRSVDPSLWLTNSMPALLIREHAILLNLGSLRAIVMQESVLIFNYNRKGGKAFIDSLFPRLNHKSTNGGQSMPFVLEVVEAALLSRIQRLEQMMMNLEPRVQALLEILPNRLLADELEQLRISKQTLVELGSRTDALRQMLLNLLEDTEEIRRICIMGRNCTLNRINHEMVCSVPLEKQIAEEQEEEIEMLLENYLQRCESCHGQAERLLDSAKEMEDSITVNLSSRRLEVSKVELLLQVGTFCVAIGALIAGIFGMNLKSYLEEHLFAFWLTTGGIIFGAMIGFFLMYSYLKIRKIL
ncbi:hypothetical protein Dimus_019929 [Dionaea muscipula]